MDKTNALARLAAIEDEARKLRAIIDAPESLLSKPTEQPLDYWRLTDDGANFKTRDCRMSHPADAYTGHGNIFQSRALAENYAKALNTFLLLRHQPGTVVPDGAPTERSVAGSTVTMIEPHFSTTDLRWKIKTNRYSGAATKLARVSPCFDTDIHALKAIEAIGEAALLHMFFTFHHFNPSTGA